MRNVRRRSALRAAFIVSFVALSCSPFQGWAGTLASAQSFALLGYAGVTNTGNSQVYGNVGVTPAALEAPYFTGFPPGVITGGTARGPATIADQALVDIDAAAVTLAGLGLTGSYSVNLGGLTVTPGVYDLSSAADVLTGTLILDAQNNPDALFVFRLSSTLTTASGAAVSVINGSPGTQVYWLVGSSVELGSGTSFEGNILAYAGIALDSTASIDCGRAFSETASVTLINNNISGDCTSQSFGSNHSDFGSLGFSGGSGVTQGIPEPGTFTLFSMGLGAGFLALRKFHRS